MGKGQEWKEGGERKTIPRIQSAGPTAPLQVLLTGLRSSCLAPPSGFLLASLSKSHVAGETFAGRTFPIK